MDRSEEQTHDELARLRRRVVELELLEAKRKQTEEALRLRNRDLALLNQVARTLNSTLDLDQVLVIALEEMRRLMNVTACSVWLIDPDTGELVCQQATGPQSKIVLGWRLSQEEGLIGWVARNDKSLIVPDAQKDERHFRGLEQPSKLVMRSIISVPLKVKQDVIGVLQALDTETGRFDDTHLILMEPLAASAALAIENARLYQRAQQEITERKQAEQALKAEQASLARRVEDRTADLSAANAELARAARLKDEFLASMSHELRTPLSAILGLSEALLTKVYGPLTEKQTRSLDTIGTSGRHLLSLINDILDISRIEAGKLELRIGSVPIEALCQASLRMIQQTIQQKHLKVSSSFDSAVTTIQADQRRLRQILFNLLSNAAKFTPEDGTIGLEVRGDVEREVIHLVVWDTGIGIAQQDMERLFQPFIQLDSSLARQYAGTGLGLVLVHRLTEMHGGSVSVESEMSKGSRFTVSLPWQPSVEERAPVDEDVRTDEPEAKAQAVPQKPAPVNGRRATNILLAEDNEANIDTLSTYLHAMGYQITVARDGAEAIQRTRERLPDVILMDIQMPGMDGLEAIRRIRADADIARVPIIALTALAMPGDRELCLEVGADEYLPKPISLKNLVEVIKAQLHIQKDDD
jgi:signal transduction histidine kinase/CheY-like chemotaxis protein